MRWIESGGGPLILIGKSFLNEWGGCDKSSDPNYGSDYDRACNTHEYAELISIPSGEAIILGDEPNRTTVMRRSGEEAIIVRWRWAPNEEELFKHFEKINENLFKEADCLRLRITDDEVDIFDSSFSGVAAVDMLTVELTPGEYTLSTIMYEPDSDTCLLLHRLRRLN